MSSDRAKFVTLIPAPSTSHLHKAEGLRVEIEQAIDDAEVPCAAGAFVYSALNCLASRIVRVRGDTSAEVTRPGSPCGRSTVTQSGASASGANASRRMSDVDDQPQPPQQCRVLVHRSDNLVKVDLVLEIVRLGQLGLFEAEPFRAGPGVVRRHIIFVAPRR